MELAAVVDLAAIEDSVALDGATAPPPIMWNVSPQEVCYRSYRSTIGALSEHYRSTIGDHYRTIGPPLREREGDVASRVTEPASIRACPVCFLGA